MSAVSTEKKAVLVDLTRCIGCRACQASCKAWNENEGQKTTASADFTNPPGISANTFTVVKMVEHEAANGQPVWNFAKTQCMHCLDPACVSACPVAALTKDPKGPVTYDYDRCYGCRYCMAACPFSMIGYEWDSYTPHIKKCTFCADRQADGMKPACTKTCPTNCLEFGDREALLKVAHERIAANKGKYVDRVYGEKEVGGTSWIYISAVPFEKLGFRNVPNEPLPALARASMGKVPAAVGGLLLGLTAIAALRKRADDVRKAEEPKKEQR